MQCMPRAVCAGSFSAVFAKCLWPLVMLFSVSLFIFFFLYVAVLWLIFVIDIVIGQYDFVNESCTLLLMTLLCRQTRDFLEVQKVLKWWHVVVQYSDMIEDFLRRGVTDCNQESLVASILLARQACLEGRHVFKSYEEWFQVICIMFWPFVTYF